MTTEELVSRARRTVGTKRTLSVPEMASWLAGLAEQGILNEQQPGDWQPTPVGAVWLRSLGEAFAQDAEIAA